MQSSEPTVYQRAVARAIQIAGGAKELAESLGVPVAVLHEWEEGYMQPPRKMFLALVEILLADRRLS